MARFRKVYGQSKEYTCKFCGKTATKQNDQGIPTCAEHTNRTVDDVRCLCGMPVEVREGKYGPYCICQQCGIQKLDRLLEMQPKKEEKPAPPPQNERYTQTNKKDIDSLSSEDAFNACFR